MKLERIRREEAQELIAALDGTDNARWLAQLFVGVNKEAFASPARLAKCREAVAPVVADVEIPDDTDTVEDIEE